jgi:hypothetical protein
LQLQQSDQHFQLTLARKYEPVRPMLIEAAERRLLLIFGLRLGSDARPETLALQAKKSPV